MPVKRLVVTNKARRQSRKLPSQIKKRVASSLLILRENPLAGAKLKGELSYYFKYRIGDYRTVYRFDKKNQVLIVVKIEHRRGVYR